MSYSAEQTLEEEEELEEEQMTLTEQNPNQAQEWETMARLWLSAFPEAKAVSTEEVESWIDSNFFSLPSDLQSMSRSDIIDRLLSIQNYMRLPHQVNQAQVSQGDVQGDVQHARFQRTDQWLPVYSWLESLDKDEVVKSKDISDWLIENPEIREQLCSKHSRYHLMHYVKKCHMKILKRREKKKGIVPVEKPTAFKVQKPVEANEQVQIPSNPLRNIPKDSDLYVAKRTEALEKLKILVELEKKLSPLFSQRLIANK